MILGFRPSLKLVLPPKFSFPPSVHFLSSPSTFFFFFFWETELSTVCSFLFDLKLSNRNLRLIMCLCCVASVKCLLSVAMWVLWLVEFPMQQLLIHHL